jgi:hypothetical protein
LVTIALKCSSRVTMSWIGPFAHRVVRHELEHEEVVRAAVRADPLLHPQRRVLAEQVFGVHVAHLVGEHGDDQLLGRQVELDHLAEVERLVGVVVGPEGDRLGLLSRRRRCAG